MFSHLEPYPGDPILSLNEEFAADSRANKINLSIGMYFDEMGRLPVPEAVKKAKIELANRVDAHPYLPMQGLLELNTKVQELIWGANHEALLLGRVATLQTVGSSGAIKLGADLIKHNFPLSEVWVSSPTWDNHRALFAGAGLKVHDYPYWDKQQSKLIFGELLSVMQTLPAKSIVVLHASCHNPTGADLTKPQWEELVDLIAKRGLMPFIDLAYQGFGQGLLEDCYVVHALTEQEVPFFCANSFSKNFSLYGERCGALSVHCPSAEQAKLVLGQLKSHVRKIYSSPPLYGAQLIACVLNNPTLRAQWAHELESMRLRILSLRSQLFERISSLLPDLNFQHFITQQGMFSTTPLTPEQVDLLKTEHGVYLLRSGRLCITGLNATNIDRVVQTLAATIKLA